MTKATSEADAQIKIVWNVYMCVEVDRCLLSFRVVPLWVGARGVEFDWKYIQMSLDSNVSLVSTDVVSSVQKAFLLI